MARSKDRDLDFAAAAIEAQFRQYERETGNPREVMLAQMPDGLRPVFESAQERFADMKREAGKAGW
jgi:hypothetical protein